MNEYFLRFQSCVYCHFFVFNLKYLKEKNTTKTYLLTRSLTDILTESEIDGPFEGSYFFTKFRLVFLVLNKIDPFLNKIKSFEAQVVEFGQKLPLPPAFNQMLAHNLNGRKGTVRLKRP